MPPRTYLEKFIQPTIADFERNPTSERHAFLACVTTFHIVDYLAKVMDGDVREQLRKHCQDFLTVDRIAHAFKHVNSGEIPGRKKPLRSQEVVSRPPAYAGVMAAGLSRAGDEVGGVTVYGAEDLDLLDVVRRTSADLDRFLAEHHLT